MREPRGSGQADAAQPETGLAAGLAALGIEPTPRLVGDLARYLRLLEKWNRAYNLTAVRESEAMVRLHVLDSLAARPWLAGSAVLDVGTGAGLPGLPLALVEPQRWFTLLDANGKKIRFVRHVLAELAPGNVGAEQARAEQFVPPDPFDTVISRAFASLAEFTTRCGGLVAAGGRLVAMKGRRPDRELEALPPGWRATAVEPVTVPGVDAARHIVVIERSPETGAA